MREVKIVLMRHEAEELRDRLSDMLCWLSGFCAARDGTDLAHDMPADRSEVRAFIFDLKRAIENATEASE